MTCCMRFYLASVRSFGLDRLLLVLAVLSAGLVFWPQTAETALLHWNIIGS